MRHATLIPALALLCLTAAAQPFAGQPYTDGDLRSDTWVATDALGRTQPGPDVAGPPRPDKTMGIFYWTWHVPRGTGGPNDNTKLIATAKDGKVDWPDNGSPHHWGEPELGYYMMTDPFVIRKHASMLIDAGIDVVMFDTTNPPFTWKDEYEALCREYTKMREEGNKTPTIAFICPFGDPMAVLDLVWKDLYKPGLWKDLWFRWEGKPFILANKDFVKDPEMLEFFTFRRPMPDYWIGPDGPDQWSWLEVYPQHVFKNSRGEAEQMSVGVAQNALPNTPGPAPMSHKRGAMGRSWHNGAKDTREGAVDLGLNFDEQWRRAMEVDPKFLFVTGWNEWVAGRFLEWSVYKDTDCYFPGGMFVDQYTQEYSRDCEPMAGGHTDSYYYQLASWVRRYKGVRPIPTAKGPAAIAVDGAFDDWKSVEPEFRDTIGDVAHRDHRGYGELVYRNDTGRNDFVLSRAAFDADRLYFFAQTAKPITARTDPMWMMLLLDADQDASTGWLGYDYVVNQEVTSDTETTVKRWDGKDWQPAGKAEYRVNGNGLELALPRAAVAEAEGSPAFDFHWADNIQSFTTVAELGVNGDSAPNRRWNYRFAVASEPPKLAFKTHRVGTYRGESCGVGDFNNDQKLDIVALPYVYHAPAFEPVKICEVEGEVGEDGKGYRWDFMNAPLDVDQDGWLDVVTCSWFGKKSEWLRNPGPAGGQWPRALVEENGNFECGEAWDVDGDGKALEIVPSVAPTVWYERGPLPDGSRGLITHVVSDRAIEFGSGCGDVNGDGRPDLIRPTAWFEAPADIRTQPWKEHPLKVGGRQEGTPGHTPQILVYDVDRDGLNDLVTSSAHEYGIFWYKQVRQGDEITWKQNLIDDTWTQAHSLALADLDQDGDLDLVTGKRFMAHNGGDPGEFDPLCVYWYELSQTPTPTWTRHTLSYDEGIGSGLNLVATDLDGDSDVDVVVTGKWGGPVWFENQLK